MASRLPSVPLGDFCAATELCDPTRAPQTPFRYVDISGVSNRFLTITEGREILGKDAPSRAKKRIRKGDVLLATTRPYLKSIALVPTRFDQCVCSTGFSVLRAKDGILPEWIFYAVQSQPFMEQLLPKMRGASYPAVTDGDVRGCKVPKMAPPEQRRVVGRIKECLSRFEEMQRLREEAEADIKVLEIAWLRQRFAELAAESPEQELARFADIKGGGTLPKGTAAQSRDTDWLLIKVGDMNLPGNEFEITSSREYLAASNRNGTWPIGTVVFPKRGGAIATNKKRLLGRQAILDPNLMGVIADPKKMRSAFLLAQFKILDLATLTSGSTVPQLNRKDLAPLPFVVPDLVTQDAVIAQAHEVSSRVRAMAEENACSAEFEALRESILREAFAGNL